jgi:hypothetical protein
MIITHLLAGTILAITPTQAAPRAATGQPTTPAPQAPARPTPTVGATVSGAGGEQIGTIASVTADAAVIDNGTNKAAVPLNAFAQGPNGFTITLTKAQFDAAAAQAATQAQAQLRQQLVAGAQVKGSDGTTVLGTVKTVQGDLVTLTTAKGDVRVPINGFAAGPNGIVSGLTAAQLEAAAATAATPSASR